MRQWRSVIEFKSNGLYRINKSSKIWFTSMKQVFKIFSKRFLRNHLKLCFIVRKYYDIFYLNYRTWSTADFCQCILTKKARKPNLLVLWPVVQIFFGIKCKWTWNEIDRTSDIFEFFNIFEQSVYSFTAFVTFCSRTSVIILNIF